VSFGKYTRKNLTRKYVCNKKYRYLRCMKKLKTALCRWFKKLTSPKFEKITGDALNERLNGKYFRTLRSDGTISPIHKVVGNCPFYYNQQTNTWRHSSLLLNWGDHFYVAKVEIVDESKVPNDAISAPIELLND